MGILDDIDSENSPDIGKDSKRNSNSGRLGFFGVIGLVALTILGSFYVIKKKPEILGLSQNSQVENQKEIEKYVAEVGKLMLLPNETPKLATVSNVDQVKEQSSFYKNAQEGDVVLVFVDAKKAILYRPSEKKIVEVGFVNTSQQDSQNSNIQVVQPSPTITPSLSPSSTTSGVLKTNLRTTTTPTGTQN
jgi:hypothetical protein